MKSIWLLSISLIGLTLFACSAPAVRDDSQRSTISTNPTSEFIVIGRGKVFFTVDMADLQFSVSVRDADVQRAKKSHDEINLAVRKYLEKEKYPNGIIVLEGTTLERDRGQTNKLDDDFYLARSTFSMRTDRVNELSTLQADLVSLGIDEIHLIKLFSSKQRELEDAARTLAIKDARQQADVTARELGWKLMGPTRVEYIESPNSQTKSFGSRIVSANSGDVPAASNNYLEAQVRVTFSYVR